MKLLAINRSAALLTGAAIADRGFIGLATFLASILVGWVGPEELGLFSLMFPGVIMAIALGESLITAPYTYYAARQPAGGERRNYLGSVLLHTWILSVVMTAALLLCAAVAYVWGWQEYVTATAILAAVVPCVLLREFARRVVYADLQAIVAAWISGGVSILQILFMAALYYWGRLTPITALVSIGLSSVIGGGLWLYANRADISFRPTRATAAFLQNWQLARWTSATQLGEVVRIQMFPWLLALALDQRTVGMYAACAAIAALAGPLQIALSNILLPQFVVAVDKRNFAAADRLMWQATAWITLAMVGFTLAVAAVSAGLVPRLYGAAFVGTQWALILLVIAQLIAAASMPAARALVGLERPDLDCYSQIAGIALNLVAGVPLVLWWGITGAAWSGALAAAIKAALTAIFYTREMRRRLAFDQAKGVECLLSAGEASALHCNSPARAVNERLQRVSSAALTGSWTEEPA